MTNYVQAGEVLTVTAPANVLSGDVVNVGAIVGVAAYSALNGEAVEVQVEGVFRLPKVTGDTIDAGQRVYWDGTAVTETPGTSSRPLIGYATGAAGAGVTTVKVRLCPTMQTGPAE